jgi:hypothetical protein
MHCTVDFVKGCPERESVGIYGLTTRPIISIFVYILNAVSVGTKKDISTLLTPHSVSFLECIKIFSDTDSEASGFVVGEPLRLEN